MIRRATMMAAMAVLLSPGLAQAQAVRPNILIIFDTSGSMLANNGGPNANDGSPQCAGTNQAAGKGSRIYTLKEAMRAALMQAGSDEANFGLMRFPQIENPTSNPVCPNGHYTIGSNGGCQLRTHSSNQTTYGTWFDSNFGEALLVGVTKPVVTTWPAVTKPVAGDFDPPDANLASLFMWLNQTEDGDNVAPIVDPEVRSGSNWSTPLGRSLFYARMYFDNFIKAVDTTGKPIDPKGACRTNTVILVTDGDEMCDTTAPTTLDASTCATTGSPSAFHPNIHACQLLKTGVKTYVVTDVGTSAANDTIAKYGGTETAVRVSLTDTSAVKAALLGIIAKTVPPPEVCNGKDDNCNGIIDEGVSNSYPVTHCSIPNPAEGSAEWNACLDIKKDTALLHCTVETCDGIDNDYDGQTDEGFARNACGAPICIAVPQETCNYKDDDCDGDTDEGYTPSPGSTCNNGLKGSCLRTGFVTCNTNGSGTVCETEPVDMAEHTVEVCNGIDDDCNGLTDDGAVIGVGETCGGGACSTGQMICLNGKLVCNATSTGGTEVCNGLDDDCNGLTDDSSWPWLGQQCNDTDECRPYSMTTLSTGECHPGTFVCKNQQLCQGCQGPRPEACNGLDDDCNGIVDDGDKVCGNSAFRCNQGRCLLLCQSGEFPCPSGYECEGDFCIPQRCNGVVCYSDEKCDNETGKCVSLCYGVTCTAPATCFNGVCVTCYSAGFECPAGEVCAGGTCQPDRCASLSCAPDEYCVDDGAAAGAHCAKVCEVVQCSAGQRCIQGQCQDDPCTGKVCDQHQFCNPSDGECHTDPCTMKVCPAGQVCVSSTATCIRNPCDTISCGQCWTCATTKDGQASCVTDDQCDARHVSSATRGATRPGCSVAGATSAADAYVLLFLVLLTLPIAALRRRRPALNPVRRNTFRAIP